MPSQVNFTKGGPVVIPGNDDTAMFKDVDGTMKTVDKTGTVTPIEGGSSGAVSTQLAVLARAQALLGTQYTSIGGADFYQNGDFVGAQAGTGAVALSGTARSGVLKVSTGATASSSASMTLAPATASQIDNVKTSKFYVVWRAALVTAADSASSQALVVTGLTGSTNFQIGCRGPTGSTFFNVIATDDGGTVRANTNTSIPLDTAYHTFEIWNDGTNINFGIDGATVITVAVSLLSGGAPARVGANTANGATATNREVDIDYSFVVTQPN